MTIETVLPDSEPAELDIAELWPLLNPEHQRMVLEIARAFAELDQAGQDDKSRRADQIQRNQGLIAWLDARLAEYEQATPEERAQGEAEVEEFKRSMNENRLPGPPLFP